MTSNHQRNPGSASVDVLQVITTADRRGAELFAMDLERELTARGRAVRTVALVGSQQVGALEVQHLGSSRLGIRTLGALRTETRRARVVIAHGSTTLPACAIATIGTRTPFIYRNIGDPTHWGTTAARRIRSALFLRRACAVVALTRATATEITERYRVAPARISVIPKGVAAERFLPPNTESRRRARSHFGLGDSARVALCLGALSSEKNVTLAIEAIATLPDVHLLIVGDGPEREAIETAAVRLAPERVHVMGSTDTPEVALAAADVVVISSWTEGLPGTLIEAGLSALPTVTTDVGFVREIVDDATTGFVVPPGDRDALAAAVARALREADTLGQAARKRCLERFSLEHVGKEWADLVTSILDSRQDPREFHPIDH